MLFLSRHKTQMVEPGTALPGRDEPMPEQAATAAASAKAYGERLTAAGMGEITTEIVPAGEFYYAEDYHQQYLAKNPNGYCGLGGTGVACPIGAGVPAAGSA